LGTLKLDAAGSSKTLACFFKTTQPHFPSTVGCMSSYFNMSARANWNYAVKGVLKTDCSWTCGLWRL